MAGGRLVHYIYIRRVGMKTVAAIYTTFAIVDTIKQEFATLMPRVRLINIIDDSLLADTMAAGEVTPTVARRLISYYQNAEEAGADVIFNTCSTMSEVADEGQKRVGIPVVKIDRPMADEAVRTGDRIGILATVETTIRPTTRLLEAAAREQGRSVTVYNGLARGAFDALLKKDLPRHDDLVAGMVKKLSHQADVFILAQSSMARQHSLLSKMTDKPILTSTRSGVMAVKALTEN